MFVYLDNMDIDSKILQMCHFKNNLKFFRYSWKRPYTILLKGGVHSFFNKLTRLKIIPDRDVPMALLF